MWLTFQTWTLLQTSINTWNYNSYVSAWFNEIYYRKTLTIKMTLYSAKLFMKIEQFCEKLQLEILLKIMYAPYWGSKVQERIGAWTYDGEIAKENCWRIIAKISFDSTMAKFCPTQILGPKPNGKYEAKCLRGSANLSGLNSFASSPHIEGSWWTAAIGKLNCVFVGTSRFPSLMLFDVCLINITTGG